MKPSEWRMIADEVRDRWGSSSKWAHAERVAPDAEAIDFAATLDTVRSMFADGRPNAPSMSEVIGATRAAGGTTTADTGPCRHRTLAIIAYHDDGSGSVGVCAACRMEFRWPAGRVHTVGDIEEAAMRRRNEPLDAPA